MGHFLFFRLTYVKSEMKLKCYLTTGLTETSGLAATTGSTSFATTKLACWSADNLANSSGVYLIVVTYIIPQLLRLFNTLVPQRGYAPRYSVLQADVLLLNY